MHFPKHLNVGYIGFYDPIKINSTYTTYTEIIDNNAVQLSKLFSKKLGFSYTLIKTRDGEYGRPLANGSWTGLIGMLLDGEIGVGFSPMVISEERASVIDFTYPTDIERTTFAARKPEYAADIAHFIKPFTPTLWLSYAISFLIMSVVFYFLFRRKYSFLDMILHLYKIILNQPVKHLPEKLREYGLMLCWIISTMVLAYSFTGTLLSFLTFPTLDGIRTIPDLVTAISKGKCICETHGGTFFVKALLDANNQDLKTVGKCLQRSKNTRNIETVLDDSITPNKKVVFVSAGDYLNPYNRKYLVSEDTFFFSLFGLSMRKDFCCKDQLEKIFSYYTAGGVIQKFLGDFEFKTSLKFPPITSSNLERPLTMEDLMGVFIILIAGYFLSLAVLLFEIITRKLRRKKSFKK